MYGIVSKICAAWVVAASMATVAGCDWTADASGNRQQSYGRSDRALMASLEISMDPAWYRREPSFVRYRLDAARGRLWTLTAAGVELYELSTGVQLARIALPGWTWVGEAYACPPDLAIGPAGEAVVSSNIISTLWRIDPVTLAASEHVLVLDEDKGKDIGFTGLVYSAAQGVYFAISPAEGSLWRIDPRLQRAQGVPLSAPLANACALAVRPRMINQRTRRPAGLCVRADQEDWIVSLAPDQRSGYVSRSTCPMASQTS